MNLNQKMHFKNIYIAITNEHSVHKAKLGLVERKAFINFVV